MRVSIEIPNCSVDIGDETYETLDCPKDLADILVRAIKGVGLDPCRVIQEMEEIE